MAAVVEKIISRDTSDRNAFLKKQNKRIKELKAVESRKKIGRCVRQKQIIEKLKRAGILDQNGDIATPYKYEEHLDDK